LSLFPSPSHSTLFPYTTLFRSSMLYLDYSRKPGEWVPNEHGGRENLGAIAFLRELNEEVYRSFPDVQTFAEESTAWPGVSRPTRSEEHTSELQSRGHLVCRLLL